MLELFIFHILLENMGEDGMKGTIGIIYRLISHRQTDMEQNKDVNQ